MRWPALVGLAAFAAVLSLFRATDRSAAPLPLSPRAAKGQHLRVLYDSILRADLREGLAARAARVSPAANGLVAVARDTGGRVTPLPDSTLRRIRYGWDRAVSGGVQVPSLLFVDDAVHDPLIPPGAERGGVCTMTVWTADAASRAGELGPCTWYATFGPPSDARAAWLDSVGALPRAVPAGFVPVDSTLREYARRYAGYGALAPLTGMTPPAYTASPAAVRCAAGDLTSCLPAAMGSDAVRGVDRLWSYWGRPAGLGGYQGLLLRDLEAEFGRDRLAAFWRSSAPVPDAFRSAFGVPMDRWLSAHLADYLGVIEIGAGRLGPVVVSALIWTLLLGGLGWAAARRLRY